MIVYIRHTWIAKVIALLFTLFVICLTNTVAINQPLPILIFKAVYKIHIEVY